MSIQEILFGLIIAIGGTWALVMSYGERLDAIDSVNWRYVEGEIVNAELVRGRGYSTKFFYSYTVNGEKYINSRITYGAQGGSLEFATSIMEKYPLSKKINVYYKSDNPEISVVEPGYSGTKIDELTQLIVPLFGLFCLVRSYKIYHDSKKQII